MFKCFKEHDINLDTSLLQKNLVSRYRDDDFDSDEEILKQGKRYVENDLMFVFNEILVIGTSVHSLVRNLRKSRHNRNNTKNPISTQY